jgi:hypothetical protein
MAEMALTHIAKEIKLKGSIDVRIHPTRGFTISTYIFLLL